MCVDSNNFPLQPKSMEDISQGGMCVALQIIVLARQVCMPACTESESSEGVLYDPECGTMCLSSLPGLVEVVMSCGSGMEEQCLHLHISWMVARKCVGIDCSWQCILTRRDSFVRLSLLFLKLLIYTNIYICVSISFEQFILLSFCFIFLNNLAYSAATSSLSHTKQKQTHH